MFRTGVVGMGTGVGESPGPLAEFAALRQEIERRSNTQQILFTLQITISGAMFSFALTGQGRSYFLLIIPISTYILTGRYVIQHYGIVYAGEYIRDVLATTVAGGLGWERWLINHRRKHLFFLEWVDPHYMAYPGVALLALTWIAPRLVLDNGLSPPVKVGMISLWFLGVMATAVCFYMVWYARRGWWRIHNRWMPQKVKEIGSN